MTKISYAVAALAIIGAVGLGIWFMNPTKPSPVPVPPGSEAAAEAVREDVAKKENVQKDEVTIVSVVSREWSNSCLGVNDPDLVCLQVITPGYEIAARAKGKTYTYHTNASGSAIVLVK